MKVDKKMLEVMPGETRKKEFLVVLDDVSAVSAHFEQKAAEEDAQDRNTRANQLGVKARYNVQPVS